MSGVSGLWLALYRPLVRVEQCGEVQRGLFVRGFSGGSFALPLGPGTQLRGRCLPEPGLGRLMKNRKEISSLKPLPINA